MIPTSPLFDQPTFQAMLDHDPVVQQYRAFFALFDWACLPERDPLHPLPGPCPHPTATYVKAWLVKLCEGKLYQTQLRTFLLQHPLLVLELGFHPRLDPTQPYGFDVAATVPCARHLRRKLHTFPHALLTDLLQATVTVLLTQIPGLGETIAVDVKHIYAWVQENNWRAYVSQRFDNTKQPTGDPDCRLGVKSSSNRTQADGSTKEVKEYLWGYGSGVVAATTPDYGDVVLAEYTQPFHANDVSYFDPLYVQAVVALQQYPTHLTADAAYDAWYVYDKAAHHGGIAAVPLNQHGHPSFTRDPDGVPCCSVGLRMIPQFTFAHTNGYRAQRYRCPLVFPTPLDFTCSHAQFAKGRGCVKDVNIEAGGKCGSP